MPKIRPHLHLPLEEHPAFAGTFTSSRHPHQNLQQGCFKWTTMSFGRYRLLEVLTPREPSLFRKRFDLTITSDV